MAEVFKESQVFEGLGSVRKITMLEILLSALDMDKPEFCRQLQLRCGGSLHRRTVGWWEARRHTPNKHADKSLRIFFGIPSIAMLGLGSRDAAPHWTWMTPEEIEEEMLHRRRMLRNMALAGAVGVAGPFLPVSDLVADAQDLDRLARIGLGAVRDSQKTATRLAIAYNAAPNGEAVRAAKAHAYTLLDVLGSGRAKLTLEVEARLQSIASDAAALAGYADLNAGRLDAAARWFTCALDLAREAGDRRLEAYALASFADIAWMKPVPNHAACVAALQSAARFQGCLPLAGRAWLFGSLGCERAAIGDDLVSGRFLEEARYAAALIHIDEPGWGWWSIHGNLAGWLDVEPEVHTAGRSMWLGRPADAVGLFDAAVKKTAPARSAGLHHHLTNLYMTLGDPEQTCMSAMTALDVAKAHELRAIPPKIRQTRLTFPREWDGLSVVRELDEWLRAA